jgi:hypothetical protein
MNANEATDVSMTETKKGRIMNANEATDVSMFIVVPCINTLSGSIQMTSRSHTYTRTLPS